MSTELKTPGVYITDIAQIGGDIVAVPTGVPAFLGYTETAAIDGKPMGNQPVAIASLQDYHACFGGAPKARFDFQATASGAYTLTLQPETRFLLYYALSHYFFNGGGTCYIVSVGSYATPTKRFSDFQAGLTALQKCTEPALVLAPDSVLLAQPEWAQVANALLDHCGSLQSRFALLDVFNGAVARSLDSSDVISGTQGFRASITSTALNYGAAYYPWLGSAVVSVADVDFGWITPSSRPALATQICQAAQQANEAAITAATAQMQQPEQSAAEMAATHQALMTLSPYYAQVMAALVAQLNLLPASAAMAGIYARTDSTVGVFNAPAGVSKGALAATPSLPLMIGDTEQVDLNTPLDGKAVNAIRLLPSYGIVAWGARTLDGNSDDWRYINVRRTLIMIEQSIRAGAQAYVFAGNTSATWAKVNADISRFLTGLWKEGALMGASAASAFSVDVGLGSTMTGQDILDGNMRVVVKLALVHPAEFIEMTFTQLMPVSS